MMDDLLNIASYQPHVTNLGPGKRFVIWLQGCPFDCKNCMSQDWIPFEAANLIRVDDLINAVIQTKDIEGITLSGGEPMMQAAMLTLFLSAVKRHRPTLTVICFTGFKLKQLEWNAAKQLLSQLDVLISGLYVDSLNDNKGLRGSSNQEVVFLTDKLIEYKKAFNSGPRQLEVIVANRDIFITGMPAKGIDLKEI